MSNDLGRRNLFPELSEDLLKLRKVFLLENSWVSEGERAAPSLSYWVSPHRADEYQGYSWTLWRIEQGVFVDLKEISIHEVLLEHNNTDLFHAWKYADNDVAPVRLTAAIVQNAYLN